MPRGPARFTVTLLLLASGLSAQQPAAKPPYSLAPTPKTIAWGYYDASTPPVLRVKSRDTVEVRTLITSSPERLEKAGVAPADVEPALREAFAMKDRLVFLDFITDQTENVFPMVPGGKGISEMILSEEL